MFFKNIFYILIKHNKNILGISLKFKGRINGSSRFKIFKFNFGKLYIQTVKIKTYISKQKIITINGVCNLELKICLNE